ncbi:MAG: EFR1 family ferrodoxin [Chitinivibrionales bacterium]
MKTVLYYFSGTGNSLQTARDIAAKLGDAQLVAIRKPFQQSYDVSAERTGIVFPVYMWGLPIIVKEFAERLAVAPDKYIFAVATFGGFPAGALGMLSRVLKSKGMTLSAAFGVGMPGNYLPLYGARSKESQQKSFTSAVPKIDLIVEKVRKRETAGVDKNSWIVNAIFSGFLYNGGSKKLRTADKKFILQETCTKCGICAKVCPVENIKLVEGKPTWLNHCEQCLACLQWCPVEAIQYAKKTIGRKRYHHPSITVSDMFKK